MTQFIELDSPRKPVIFPLFTMLFFLKKGTLNKEKPNNFTIEIQKWRKVKRKLEGKRRRKENKLLLCL